MSEHNRRYGWPHRRLRAQYARDVARGIVVCWRCGYPIASWEQWDLGHVDGDPTRYAGPEHRRCNRQAGAVQGNQARESPRFVSREW